MVELNAVVVEVVVIVEEEVLEDIKVKELGTISNVTEKSSHNQN